MRSLEIQKLIRRVEPLYGPISLYGSSPEEEHGTCFTIKGIPATFSVHTQDGTLPPGQYDVQIEGIPPGDYVYPEILFADSFLRIIQKFNGPEDEWPLSCASHSFRDNK